MFSDAFLERFPHAWALGLDEPLANLVNVAADLWSKTKPRRFPPRQAVIDLLPVREAASDHTLSTQGKSTSALIWDFLPLSAFQYVIAEYFTDDGLALAEVDMTVYLEVVERNAFFRWNVKAQRPVPNRDYVRVGDIVTGLNIPLLLEQQLEEPEP